MNANRRFAARALARGLAALLCCGGVGATPQDQTGLRLDLPPAPRPDWAARMAEEWRAAPPPADTRVRIVELPPEGLPGTAGAQRVRHALSVRSEAPQRMLRSLGVDASDCSTRLRVPTKLRQGSGGGIDVAVRAHVGLACRF